MLKLDPTSVDKTPNSIDFFNSKPTLIAFQSSNAVEYAPTNSLNTWPIHFRVNSGLTYQDLSRWYLVTSFRITKKEGDKITKITKADPVSFIQGFGGTFIKNLKVSFNGRVVYNSNDLYAYNAFMRRRLGIETSKNEDDLSASGYFEDGLSQTSGPGFEARRSLFENDATFETVCTIDADIFRQKKLMLNEMTIDIEITPHNNFFALISTGTAEYQYHIVDCRLYTRQSLMLPQLDFKIQEKLNANAIAKYNYTRNVMSNYFINAGRYDFNTSLYRDYLPKRVFAALVDAKAFHGHIGMSPFEFAPFNLTSIQLITNGAPSPAYPYRLNWNQKLVGRAYKDLLDTVGNTHGISIAKYMSHSCIFAFDLQAQHSDQVNELQAIGATSMQLEFSQPIPTNGVQLIVFGEFNSLLGVDKSRTFVNSLSV